MTILVDSSMWIGHLRRADPRLQSMLEHDVVVTHPFVLGELACGHLARRREVLGHLGRLPSLDVVSQAEALAFVEAHRLAGSGLGWIDVHLLAAARLADATLCTTDRALARAAGALGIAY